MTKKSFAVTFELKDFRETREVSPDKQVQSYLMTVKHGDQHFAYWSQPITDEEVGTRRSFWNAMDVLRQKILEKLSPQEESKNTYP